MKLRATTIYPTATKDTWFRLHGSTIPYAALSVIGISREAVDSERLKKQSHSDAYEFIKKHMLKFSAKELELMMIEQSQSDMLSQTGHC